jgi:DNA-binding NarL/FixJ family response regulator
VDQSCGPVLVVDDHPGLRAAVRTILERGGLEVLEAESGDVALELAATARPALVILDVNLGGTSGYAVCHELRQRNGHQLPIIFLSGARTEPFDRVAGLLIGADDYMTKPFDPDELLARVSRMIEQKRARRVPLHADGLFGLTTREREVLTLLFDGLNQVEIAERLYLSPKTIGTHIQRILGKMGVRSRTQAVAVAARDGLFHPPR